MIKNISKEFRKAFLLKFVEQLILNSKNTELLKLEAFIERKEREKGFVDIEEAREETKKEIRKELKERYNPKIQEKKTSLDKDPFSEKIKEKKLFPSRLSPPIERYMLPRQSLNVPKRRILKIPVPKPLPPQFENLKPVATNETIDLGKLNILIQDRNVKSIECEGAGTKVIVMGLMGRKPTNIMLSAEEIEEIISTFSMTAMIPRTEGPFRVVVGNLMLTAIISNSVGVRFIIKKIEKTNSLT